MLRKMIMAAGVAAMLLGSVLMPAASTSTQAGTCATTYNCNCVLYVRCRWVPSLPTGLTTKASKIAIINSYTPSVGAVAIMTVGTYGHVAYVTAVKKDARGNVVSITVDEANYSSCKVGQRTNSPSAMKVAGYYVPGAKRQ
jgi:hypothetical protein